MISNSKEEKEALMELKKKILNRRSRNKRYTLEEIKILLGIDDNVPRNMRHPLANIIIKNKEIGFTVKAVELPIKRHIQISGKANFTYKKDETKIEVEPTKKEVKADAK